ncbi:unnamed protein product, partial [Prunus brigantina]
MIQDMVPHARRIVRPVYRRPYSEHFDQEEFQRGFKASRGLQTKAIFEYPHRGIFLEVSMADLVKISQNPNESVQEYLGPQPTFYRDSTKPSGPRTTAVHAVDIEDIEAEERYDEVYLEEEEESTGVNLAEIVAKGPYVCKALSKASKDQRPTTAQVSKFSET